MRKLVAVVAVLPLAFVIAGCGGSDEVVRDVGAAVGMIERAELTAAEANLQQWYRAHGTYAGANPGVPGVTLVRGDGNGWCLETAGAHEAGPGGAPAAGPC
jgi:hypothetical protein